MLKLVEIKSHNLTLRGMLHKPDKVKGKVPIVIIFHGFLGNKMGPHFIFAKLSRILEEHGIASVRFDFGGSGESDGEFSDMTLSRELEDAERILDFVQSLDFIDRKNINILGLSMGGAVGSMLAGKYAKKINSLILWAPAGNMGEVTWEYFIGSRKYEFMRNGWLEIDGLVIGKDFVNDVSTLDIYKKAAGFNKKVFIVHGDEDVVVPLKASEKYKELYGENAELLIITGADHTFDKKEWEAKVINRTSDFILSDLKIDNQKEAKSKKNLIAV